jgi:hypothetical protein
LFQRLLALFENLLLGKLTILNHRVPNIGDNLIINPSNSSKKIIIPLDPKRLEAHTFQKWPEGFELLKTNRGLFRKDDLLHFECMPWARVCPTSTKFVDQSGRPIPNSLHKGT